ncbi:Uu.00g074060.m01.CDS01 [Anthostomella pinea]|uniref:Uu.00g074060.m01.CDS01 n=1 Tax=Anthostomella pinea TaxID=933095 RepID=A0AAI8YP47_9PEZI|nr:Uu.00g074060.m01.CDS01 [Anthostomella pinea]
MLNNKLQKLMRQKDNQQWERDWGYKPVHRGKPLRALVKEFVDAPILHDMDAYKYRDFNLRLVNAMMDRRSGARLIRNLKTLHRSGILCRDINTGNVLKGLFIDFSTAWTVPHPMLTPEKMQDSYVFHWSDQGYQDVFELQELLDIWNEEHDFADRIWARIHPDSEYCRKLRSYQDALDPVRRMKRPYNRENYGWRFGPEKYTWQAAERKRRLEESGGFGKGKAKPACVHPKHVSNRARGE